MTLNGLVGLPFSINSTNLVNATGSILTFQISGNFTNYCPIIANFTQILMNINYTGQVVGNASSSNIQLQPGSNSFTFTAQLNGTNSQLVNAFILNTTFPLLVSAALKIGASDPPSLYLTLFTRNITINGMAGIPFIINTINLTNANSSSLTLQINGNFTNPCLITANFSQVMLNCSYQGQWIGNATIQNFQLQPGTNQFVIQAILNGSNSQLINNFIQNATLTFQINATLQINLNDPVSAWIPLFTKNITINGFNGLNPNIQSINLTNATTAQLILSVQANFFNPTSLTTNLSRIWVDILYLNQYMGNASASNITMIPGTNQIQLNATFGGNMTAINNFISNYLSNITIQLQLQVNVTILGININTTNWYQFPSLSQPLISVVVTVILSRQVILHFPIMLISKLPLIIRWDLQ